MPYLRSLAEDELAIVNERLEVVQFPEGTCIIEQGSAGDGCYFIDEGTVRVEFDTGETNTDVVLNYLESGMVMGEFSLIDHQPRSASLYAHTDVTARWLATEKFNEIVAQYPHIGAKILTAISSNLIQIVRHTNRQLADLMTEGASTSQVDTMIADAHAAQKSFQGWPEEKVDAMLKDMVDTISLQAESLAEATVKESGLGNVKDKIEKIRFSSQGVYNILAGKPAAGLLHFNEKSKIEDIASPMGVILGIIPLTNPVPTMIFKTLICLKSRNALIMSCHRNALGVGNRTGALIQDILKKHGAPVNLVQWIHKRSSRKLTNMFMRHKNMSFILATGGPSIVKAAYSSGTPAIGVGAGNAPVYVTTTADVDSAAQKAIESKSFDNGIICGSDNNLVVDASRRDSFIDALERHGSKILDEKETEQLTAKLFDLEKGRMNVEMIGQSAQFIARKSGIPVEDSIRLIVVPVGLDELSGPYGYEKLAPMLSLFTVHDEAEAIDVCKRLLLQEGSGHTAIIHTADDELAKRYAVEMPASRILVNVGGSLGCIGGGNGLLPSLTLGCGTLGGTSTTDNVTYKNLLNIKRLAFAL